MRRRDFLQKTSLGLGAGWVAAGRAAAKEVAPLQHAEFLAPPRVVVPHTPERSFIGPALFQPNSSEIVMVAPWGRPPVNFHAIRGEQLLPPVYRSRDGGRTWQSDGRLNLEWDLPGYISDGGLTFLKLRDGRLALLIHRHVADKQGGGRPAIAFSTDDGRSWTAPQLIGDREDIYYVMNDRMIQTRSGRLLVPVAVGRGKEEGDSNTSRCFYSDDAGQSWKLSPEPVRLSGQRGMAEPCVVELKDGRILMLARTGQGSHHQSTSSDGGETWSPPQPTTLRAACSPLTLRRLPDGRLITFYNHAEPLFAESYFPRAPLVYATSADEGAAWSPPVVLDDESPQRQHIYPGVCFLPEGMLIVYSTHFTQGDGSFGSPPGAWKIGGGKSCLAKYPA